MSTKSVFPLYFFFFCWYTEVARKEKGISIMANRLFGYTKDGEEVSEYTLKSGRVAATVLTLGGILHTLTVDGRDIVGGYDCVSDYENDGGSYQGALIGRVGNRIGGASFVLNGKTYSLAKNDNEKNHLHGGDIGFNARIWTVEEADDMHLTLSLVSPDGEEGYPGNLFVKVTYTLAEDALMIAYNAVTDADTPINLTNHSYFNLNGIGSGDVLSTVASIHADRVTEVDDELIPTGRHIDVTGTPFDFRTPHTIGERLSAAFPGYDHNFLFAGAEKEEVLGILLPHVATFRGDSLTMEVYTDRPGAQLYTANFLSGKPDFKGGIPREKRHYFCFETQEEPDAVHHGGAPLHPGELFHTVTVFRFI